MFVIPISVSKFACDLIVILSITFLDPWIEVLVQNVLQLTALPALISWAHDIMSACLPVCLYVYLSVYLYLHIHPHTMYCIIVVCIIAWIMGLAHWQYTKYSQWKLYYTVNIYETVTKKTLTTNIEFLNII